MRLYKDVFLSWTQKVQVSLLGADCPVDRSTGVELSLEILTVCLVFCGFSFPVKSPLLHLGQSGFHDGLSLLQHPFLLLSVLKCLHRDVGTFNYKRPSNGFGKNNEICKM